MKPNLLKNSYAAIVALFVAVFALPTTAQAEKYFLEIAGKQVDHSNRKDLTVIKGVTGKASYDTETKTLTLENATIKSTITAVATDIDGLTINLIGTNTFISEKKKGLFIRQQGNVTITGTGKLIVQGSTTAKYPADRTAIQNMGIINVSGCTVEATGGAMGITDGTWNFDRCNMRIKGGGDANNPNIGSICMMKEKAPQFNGCEITEPAGTEWKELKVDGKTVFSLFGADRKVVTDWVTIKPQNATEYPIKIAGTTISSDNCDNLSVIPGVTGIAKYDPLEKVLFLEDATLTTDKAPAILSDIEGLKIDIKGTSNLTSGKYPTIRFEKPATITGGGTISLESTDSCGIRLVKTTLIIEGCTVNAKGKENGIAGTDGKGERLTINNATVTAEGKEKGSVAQIAKLTLDGSVITAPMGAKFDKQKKAIVLDGNVVTEKVTIVPGTLFSFTIAGAEVHSANCKDLTVIPGVKGKVAYDNGTRTLTLENASIETTKEEYNGIANTLDGLNIVLVGNNTITAEKGFGLSNYENCAITFKGNGKLVIKGSTNATDANLRIGIINMGSATVKDCELEVSAGVYGIGNGEWTFDNCKVRAKGNGSSQDENAGSICWLKKRPVFVNCKIVEPENTNWKDAEVEGKTYFTLIGADGKAVTDWVTIGKGQPTGINTATTTAVAAEGIYTLSGVRMSGELNKLPKGIYIVNGKKIVKQ